jgi:sigma-E factor negative regulatory protein RseC
VQEISMLKAAFIVYLMPLLAIFGGALLGNAIADYFDIERVFSQIIGGGIFLFLSIWYIKYYDYNSRVNEKMRPVIVSILSK